AGTSRRSRGGRTPRYCAERTSGSARSMPTCRRASSVLAPRRSPARLAPRRRLRVRRAAHLVEIALPESRAEELEDLARLVAPPPVAKRLSDGVGVRLRAAEADGFEEQFLIDHKSCAFHMVIAYTGLPTAGCAGRGTGIACRESRSF